MENIDEQLQTIIAEIKKQNTTVNFSNSIDLVDDLYFNSLDLVLLIIKIEEYFNIEITSSDLQKNKFSSYKTIKYLIQSKINIENS
ncbi:phosphopantetheine-binding protein [Streptococcus parasanguinis]|uniref:acyl carrier protein n=1 Tax=Streptococcus parasanguinis TaxID=1318 RepID=UPI0039C39ED2